MRALPGSPKRGSTALAPGRQGASAARRARILAATAELVAERGYLGFRVEDLLSRASVSHPTLRKLFGDKRGCYLALLERCASEAERCAGEAWEAEPGPWPRKQAAAITALFGLAGEHPSAARACLLEPFAAGPAAIERCRRALAQLDSLLAAGRAGGAQAAAPATGAWEGLAGGVLWAPWRCLAAGKAESIPAQAPQAAQFALASWWGRGPALRAAETALAALRHDREDRDNATIEGPPAQAAETPLGPLPQGRHHLTREVVEDSQRERLLAAVAEAVAERGFAATRVSDVVGRAAVSRRVFYANFETIEQCLIAVLDIVGAHLRELVAQATAQCEGEPPQRVIAALRAALGFFAAEPGLARLALVESLAAGADARERYHEAVGNFAAMLGSCGGAIASAEPCGGSGELAVGALAAALSMEVATQGVESLPAHLPELGALVLRPYLGCAEAERASLEAWPT